MSVVSPTTMQIQEISKGDFTTAG